MVDRTCKHHVRSFLALTQQGRFSWFLMWYVPTKKNCTHGLKNRPYDFCYSSNLHLIPCIDIIQ